MGGDLLNKHYAKFYGNVVHIEYRCLYCGHFKSYYIQAIPKSEKCELIWEGYIDQPLFEEDEIVRIPNLKTDTVKIVGRVRDIDEGCDYYTDYTIKEIIDEESKKAAEKNKKDGEELRKKQEEDEKRTEEEQEKMKLQYEKEKLEAELPKKKWYQFWK